MTVRTKTTERGGAFVHANGIDIHYVEVGRRASRSCCCTAASSSTGPVWAATPSPTSTTWTTLGRALPGHRSRHPWCRRAPSHGTGTASFAVLADDVRGAHRRARPRPSADRRLQRRRDHRDHPRASATPTPCGRSSTHAGYDMLQPATPPSFAMVRLMLRRQPRRHRGDPDAAEAVLHASHEMAATLRTFMKADHDGAQGDGHWRHVHRAGLPSLHPARPGYTFDDLGAVTAPTLVLTGDRDHFCSVEEAVIAVPQAARPPSSRSCRTTATSSRRPPSRRRSSSWSATSRPDRRATPARLERWGRQNDTAAPDAVARPRHPPVWSAGVGERHGRSRRGGRGGDASRVAVRAAQ